VEVSQARNGRGIFASAGYRALPSQPPAGVAGRGAEFRGGKLRLDRLDPDERTVDRSQFEVDRRRRTVYMTWPGATGEQVQQTATKPQRRPARTKPPSPQQFRRR
jgi:hypothetical protein